MAAGESEKTEKITINLGLVDLGQIDLLVQEGFYTNRTDFIRTAIRTQLAARSDALDQTVTRRTLTLGNCYYTRRDLEEIRETGQMIHIRVLGLATIAADVSPQLALDTIASGRGTRRLPGPHRREGRPRGSHRLSRRDHNGPPRTAGAPGPSAWEPATDPPEGIPSWTTADGGDG